MLYETECSVVKNQHKNKVCLAEMMMLRWMCGKIRRNNIKNDYQRES
jgi:hypothetical protein